MILIPILLKEILSALIGTLQNAKAANTLGWIEKYSEKMVLPVMLSENWKKLKKIQLSEIYSFYVINHYIQVYM